MHPIDPAGPGASGGAPAAEVALGCVPSVARALIPAVIAARRALGSACRIRLYDQPASELDRSVRDGTVDFAIGPAGAVGKGLETGFVAEEPLVAVAPESWWPGRNAVAWSEVSEIDLVAVARSPSVRRLIDGVQRGSGAALRWTFEVQSLDSALAVAAAGGAAVILPKLAASCLPPGVRRVRLTDPAAGRQLVLLRAGSEPMTALCAALYAGCVSRIHALLAS